MDTHHKNCLQVYCQKIYYALPRYEVIRQSNPPAPPKFEVKVEVNGQYFVGDAQPTKKAAEQSAAKNALEALESDKPKSTIIQSYSQKSIIRGTLNRLMLSSPPAYSSSTIRNFKKQIPSDYADIEEPIINTIEPEGGRIRKLWASDEQERFSFENTETYRYRGNVDRLHGQNHIYFISNPTYKICCHDPGCSSVESIPKSLRTNKGETSTKRKSSIKIDLFTGKRRKCD